ncbi:MAG: bifunctional UDP-sugar hydrolase/5'-nucleotidase [Sphaerochaetaceae bacterium]|nr:bifunctional UDP-sugar hydrolase/5'-nucleotidase [Sphaerochaetaceae bacterium]MDD4396117.1 bifunctional UDP-sugar hydrolase/5'-nucleotidase [Sphaerochaetaceae bacterium]
MKRSTRSILLLVAAIIVVMCFAGCATKSKPEAQVSETVQPVQEAVVVESASSSEAKAPVEETVPAAEPAPVTPAEKEIAYPYGVTPIVKDASGATEFDLYVVHTNDVHARVTEGQDGSMGYAKLATLLKWGRSLTDDILLLDAGDVTHGTNFANLFKGQTILNLLDMLGYDAVAPGNHDFNYGFDVLKLDAQVAAKYSTTRVLCANILDENGVLQFQPYQIYDFNGFRVAVIGLSTPDTKTKAHPKYTEGLTFMSDLVVNNAQYALDLAHQYADYVVVLGHIGEDADGSSGITSDWICENLNGIDLFVDGHSHTDEPGKVVNGALIVQAGQYLKEVGVVQIHVKDGKAVSEYSLNVTADDVTKPAESDLARRYGIAEVPADEEVSAYIESVNAQIDEVYSEVIATVPMKLDGERAHVRTKQTNLSKMICAAMTAETGADFTITNGGGIRASIAKGNVTVGDVNTVLPFTNTIAVVEITGAQVYEALEHGYSKYPETNGAFSQSDLQVVFNPIGKEGYRILKVLLNGKAIAKDGTVYHCATNDFVAAGGDGYTMMGKVTQVGRMLNEVFLDYLKANYPVK